MPEPADAEDTYTSSALPPLGAQRSALSARIAARRSESNADISPRPASGDFRISLSQEALAPTVTEYGTPNFSAFGAVPMGTPFGYLVSDANERRSSAEQEVGF